MNRSDARLRFQRCAACAHRWYFTRPFCPACGGGAVQTLDSQGAGILYSATLVHRAPSEEFRPLVPFSIVLVDLHEGFRVMGHAEAGLSIGAPVVCEMRQIAGRPLPFFHKDSRAS